MSSFPVTAIRDSSIKLGQFIKLASLVETGGEAKEVISAGRVEVNGQVETHRGHTLHLGDVVTIGSAGAEVGGPDDEDDYFDEATADDDFDPEKWRNM
ncbi:RNA-binding S4 domain-containing protein [uncultured Corynebacterium sp.]|uniref:RNA-binding S4 domain-containing protein n=1 Tax=uncultured Corynebacterium sp. TaxID=159447 RepID=UPI0025ECD027|nr:RNA-binding S4 domain-containing protein [uncultured Corynebacterium sp.]